MTLSKPFAFAAAIFAAMTTAAGAQSMIGDAEAGLNFARTNCATCHAIEPPWSGREAEPPRDFDAIARDPSTTETSLRVFFQTSHLQMPNFVFSPAQTDDLVAYLLSLRVEGEATD